MNVTDMLRVTKAALLSEQKLHRCNQEEWKRLQNEISEIDYLIIRQERADAKRRSIYEKRIRAYKRNRDREIRRRIYLGLRMGTVNADRNLSDVRSGIRGLRTKRKAGM